MSQPIKTDTLAKLAFAGLIAALAFLAWLAAGLGEFITPTGTFSWNVPELVGIIRSGHYQWPPAATWLLIVLVIATLVGFGALSASRTGTGKGGTALAARLATGAALAPLALKASSADAATLHPKAENLPPGQTLGTTIAGKTMALYQGWRKTGLAIIPPGGGKTSTLVIPRMIAAPGPAIMTTNKIDGVPQVVAGRATLGRTWMFDPTGIFRTKGRPDFIFNPLTLVKGTVSAVQLAMILINGAKKNNKSTEQEAKDDAHFGPAGEQCFAWALLAAAVEGQPLSTVHAWMARGELARIQAILARAGFDAPANEIAGFDKWPDKTRGSLIATVQRMCRDLAHQDFRDWTTPTPGIREFDPAAFLDSKDTLILLSEREPGGTGSVISSMIKAITEAAKEQAPGEARLRVPLVGELDEVANIVPWPTLPADFSYFGSRGLCFTIYLQGWSQGVLEWGVNGMKSIWQFSGIRLVGANEETDWTQGLSRTIGTWEKPMGEGKPTKTEPRAGLDDFANLPERTVFLFSPVAPAALIRLLPWYKDKKISETIANGEAAAQAVMAGIHPGEYMEAKDTAA